jgi:hypothetical protein
LSPQQQQQQQQHFISKRTLVLPHLLIHSPQDCLVNVQQTLEFANCLAKYYGEPTPLTLNTFLPSRQVVCYTTVTGGHWEPIRHCAPHDPEDQLSPLIAQFLHLVNVTSHNRFS